MSKSTTSVPTPSVPVKAPSVPVKAPSVPVKAPSVPVKAPSVPVKAPSVPVKAPSVPVKAPSVPVKAPSVPVKAPSVPAPSVPAPSVPATVPSVPATVPSVPKSTSRTLIIGLCVAGAIIVAAAIGLGIYFGLIKKKKKKKNGITRTSGSLMVPNTYRLYNPNKNAYGSVALCDKGVINSQKTSGYLITLSLVPKSMSPAPDYKNRSHWVITKLPEAGSLNEKTPLVYGDIIGLKNSNFSAPTQLGVSDPSNETVDNWLTITNSNTSTMPGSCKGLNAIATNESSGNVLTEDDKSWIIVYPTERIGAGAPGGTGSPFKGMQVGENGKFKLVKMVSGVRYYLRTCSYDNGNFTKCNATTELLMVSVCKYNDPDASDPTTSTWSFGKDY